MEKWTVEQIATAVLFLAGFIGGVRYLLGPVITYNKQQKEVNDRFEDIDTKLDNDNKRINRLESDNKQILLTLLALIQHDIDGNDIEALKKRKKELSEYMVQMR